MYDILLKMAKGAPFERLIWSSPAKPDPKYEYTRLIGVGVNYFRTPVDKDGIYFAWGDPGIDTTPRRNAPVLGVWKVNDFPKERAELDHLWRGKARVRPPR